MSKDWVNAADAAHTLGVTRATLYAYVSRGLVRSESGTGARRERRYARDDLDRLRRRAEERRNPDKVAAHALQWGMPVLESSITLIADETLYYRGHDAVTLARSASVDAVASLVWTGRLDSAVPSILSSEHANARRVHARATSKADPFIVRTQAALALASAADSQAFDLRLEGVVRTGWRILNLLVAAASPAPPGMRAKGIDAALARGWRARAGGEEVIRAALILCADHELNVSAFTARCVASAGSHPYAVVVAGLSALEGVKHGGSTARVESLLAATRRARSLRAALTERLREGSRIDGFGHPLYRKGDPRAAALLEMLAERFPRSPELRFAREFARVTTSLTGEKPNVDFALGAVSRVLGLPAASGLTLFAIGRTIGWIGHAIEQYAVDQIIRPRARYVGVAPGSVGPTGTG
ncbi:MAG: citrate synthase [bacterium]